jgi:D-aminoacyl-tRNA deacylase
MRAVVQRVSRAAVRVDGVVVGSIGPGLCVLLSVGPGDDVEISRHLAARIAGLRIFPDDAGRMNRDVAAASGSVLVVSQFTLHANTSRGHRPSFIGAADPGRAERLYEVVIDAFRSLGLEVAGGSFGAHMEVELVNDGPVTLVLTSGEEPWPADAG